jgi:hypothetical protein
MQYPLSILNFGLRQGHEDKLTRYMNTLKQTFGHPKDISSAPRVYDMNPTVLSGMALNQ